MTEAQKAYVDCPVCGGVRVPNRPCARCNDLGTIPAPDARPAAPYGWQVPHKHHWS